MCDPPLRWLLDHADQAIVLTDSAGCVRYMNAAARALAPRGADGAGVSVGEVLGSCGEPWPLPAWAGWRAVEQEGGWALYREAPPAPSEGQRRSEAAALSLEEAEHVASVAAVALGSPLTALRLALEALSRDGPPAEGEWRAWMDIVREQVEQVEEVFRHLLELARPPSPGQQRVDLNQVVRDTLALLLELAGARSPHLQLTLAPHALPVAADAGSLRQLCFTLVHATIAAGARGLRASTCRRDGFVEFAVCALEAPAGEGGPLLDDAAREIFRARQIARRHGGFLQLGAAAPPGAAFLLAFPLLEDHGTDS